MFYVFIGGGLGSILRYFISQISFACKFPLNTFFTNLISCFIIGFLFAQNAKSNLSANNSLLFKTGFCGGLSTFSTFIEEISKLLMQENYIKALYYFSTSIFIGVIFFFA